MMNFLIYLIIGASVTGFIELIVNLDKKINGERPDDNGIDIGGIERTVLIIIWPIVIVLFIFYLLKKIFS